MLALSARSASRCVTPSARALSEEYCSIGRSRSSAGAAGAAAAGPAVVKHARPSATASARLPLKDLLLTHGDRLAPPPLVAGQCDVLARHPRRRALLVPDREEHVLAGRKV